MGAEWITGALLWQMLIGLVQGYSSTKRSFFDDHVEPLQNRVVEIHNDYTTGFEEVRRLLKDGTHPTDDLIEFLRERRRDYEYHRQLSRDLAAELERTRRRVINDETWIAVENYCEAVADYFSAGAGFGAPSWYTGFLDIVEGNTRMGFDDVWFSSAFSDPPRYELLRLTDYILNKGLP